MRDRDTIDSELRRLAAVRRSISRHGGELSSRQIDALLDERLGHPTEPSETEGCTPRDETAPYRRNGVLRRFGLLAALPLSLIAVAAVLVVMFAVHKPQPTAQPTEAPPSSARPNPPPPDARPAPAAPPLAITDRAFVDVLKQEGLPVPSTEYAMNHGHAVCDFLADQPSFADAVRFVQESSIWDAAQSTQFAAGAIASYCPQYDHARSDEMQQTLQKVLSDLQAIQGHLQGIQDGLQAIPGQ